MLNLWQFYDQRLDWFQLREGDYVSLQSDDAGIVRSEVFPGLWLAVPALLAGDLAQVLSVLQEGLATPEHGAFDNGRRDSAVRSALLVPEAIAPTVHPQHPDCAIALKQNI